MPDAGRDAGRLRGRAALSQKRETRFATGSRTFRMIDRRFVLTGALALLNSPAHAQDNGPQQLVRRLYRPGFEELQMPMSRTLKQFVSAALERSRRLDEPVAGLDFAWTTGTQDGEGEIERTLVVRTIVQTLGNAVVEARFRDPQPTVVQYRVVKEEGRWVIDDIEYPASRQRLSKLLARGARGES